MLCTVMGLQSKPYEVNGSRGVSYRVSLFGGQYESDSLSGAVGVGDLFFEVKCPANFFNALEVNKEYSFDFDDKRTRIKNVLESKDGAFYPVI